MIKVNNPEGAVYDADKHRYFLRGRPIVGITEALGSVGLKPSLDGIPQHTLERVRTRGSYIHAATQYEDEGDLGEIAPEHEPYLAAYRQFKKDYDFRPEPAMIERWMIHGTFYYGGIPDRGGYLGKKKAVLEVKTTVAGVEDWVEFQTALQAILLTDNAGFKPEVRCAVALFDDGKYEFRIFKDHRAQALALGAVAIASWKLGRK